MTIAITTPIMSDRLTEKVVYWCCSWMAWTQVSNGHRPVISTHSIDQSVADGRYAVINSKRT
ncbi:hypothetical protein [Leptolyngbya iicbica]|uniref:Uncharacterized protein n=2 Tax=Cyanophyceae TaxID=3028117 RepID=A0A4Q7E1N4_9CYAN|nr:hypothetical protein [Leptolyngbya sp. LK]RZM75060.1 hypothetical protein DYY88_22380 [Leptolyngbya sp. LK]